MKPPGGKTKSEPLVPGTQPVRDFGYYGHLSSGRPAMSALLLKRFTLHRLASPRLLHDGDPRHSAFYHDWAAAVPRGDACDIAIGVIIGEVVGLALFLAVLTATGTAPFIYSLI